MDLRGLGYVVAIVDEGGFGKAAAALGVTQPSLSHAVKALENELGAQLFHRLGRSVSLTPAGEALLGPARQALRDADVARAAVAQVAGLEAGRLDLVCLPTLAVDPVADLVGRFRTRHPGVRVHIDEPEDADAVAELVRTGASELGFAELPLRLPDLDSVELAAHEFVAVLPASGHGDGRRITIAELAELPLVTTPPGTSTRRQVDEAFATAGLTPTIAVETDHREALVALVRAGAGIAILPEPVAGGTDLRGAVVRAITPAIHRRIGLIRRPGPLSPAAQAFTALAVPGAPATTPRPRARRRPAVSSGRRPGRSSSRPRR
jgi:DNA-binding transcriptional LysR family regulator